MSQTPILALPDFSKPLVIEKDTCKGGVAAVMMQDGNPIVYLSKALNQKHLCLIQYKKWKENLVAYAFSRLNEDIELIIVAHVLKPKWKWELESILTTNQEAMELMAKLTLDLQVVEGYTFLQGELRKQDTGVIESKPVAILERRLVNRGNKPVTMSVKMFKGRLAYFSINSIKPKNSIWKKIKMIMPQKNYEEEEDEFYTLDELDELDQSMAYLARKFSNIKVKKPRFFKGKGQSFTKDNSWKGKGKYTFDSKNGYKTGSVNRLKIRCYNCNELGHFAIECRKPKKAMKDKAYLELEVKC
ncbi:hypothetical protein AgCh_012052 [Apium graveolens]